MTNTDPGSFPVLSTERLRLRQLQTSDDRDLYQFRSHPEVGRYLSRPLEESIAGCRDFIENISEGIRKREWYYWGLSLPDDRVIGTICLWNLWLKDGVAEIGYELHPDFQKKGLMQEALGAVLDFAFQKLQLRQIEAYLQVGNHPSIRLLERNGFRFLKKVGEEEKFAEETAFQLIAYRLEREEWS
jgi:ribosomal-protein-alanine N-acetyltransferase